MLPSEIRVLAVFPLTPNGKVDRRSLLQILDSETAQLPTPVASTRFLLDGELVDRLAAAFETISGQVAWSGKNGSSISGCVRLT